MSWESGNIQARNSSMLARPTDDDALQESSDIDKFMTARMGRDSSETQATSIPSPT
jgi:hypothetical protein